MNFLSDANDSVAFFLLRAIVLKETWIALLNANLSYGYT
jgi:hypothetical protein